MTTPTAPIASTTKKSTSSNSTPQLQDTTKQTLIIRCPRCDSSNTKFCYYNNYSLSQPRHFCKTCRRYWTQGGALRNVPVGGGCRKNKKLKSSEISSSGYNKFLPSAVDFLLGGGGETHQLYGPFGIGTLNPNNNRFGVEPPSVLTMGFNHNFASNKSSSHHLASSIESLSCINQDMHWKLQQQRFSVLFATDTTESHDHQKHGTVSKVSIQQSQMEEPMEEIYSSLASASKGKEEWLFVNSGSSVNIPNSMGDHDNLGNPATTNWSTNGVQATWGS